jgi:hypothetical protein
MYVRFVAMFMIRRKVILTMVSRQEQNLKICRMTGNALYAAHQKMILKKNNKKVEGK